MIFSNVEFFAFLAIVLAISCFPLREGMRRNVLLVASYIFYAWWDWRFCFLLFATTTLDFNVARWIFAARDPVIKRRLLIASIVANLGVLGFFKYTNFFVDSFAAATGVAVPHLSVILPAGISFYTFASMSYTIDVYRGELEPLPSLRDFSFFVSFFPHLVAGPIVRASFFVPQLKGIHPLKWNNIRLGAEIFLRGFAKKVLFADTLAVFADPVFKTPGLYSSPTCWMAVIAYALQIYYDFSGYTDMAIGTARMFGFEFPENFRHPYLSRSVTEFWRRWHITLSTWLRDYLYIPLGGNRRGRSRMYLNLFITMLLGGLWHGAAWTFVIWGGLHGCALAIHKAFQDRRVARSKPGPILSLLSWTGTQVFVLVCWVFFRSETFGGAFTFLKKMMFIDAPGVVWYHIPSAILIAASVGLHLMVLLRDEAPIEIPLRRPIGWAIASAMVVIILLYAPLNVSPFIYFQF